MVSPIRGPSPRSWGKPIANVNVGAFGRTIPTVVGKTSFRRLGRISYTDHPTVVGKTASCSRGCCVQSDHPHERGENSSSLFIASTAPGPSPRSWGKQLRHIEEIVLRRTIPTVVGKTAVSGLPGGVRSDHPHGRGENSGSVWSNSAKCGPSPRSWGKLSFCTCNGRCVRTIPTVVGKTHRHQTLFPRKPDHPHGRGENIPSRGTVAQNLGPSPRAWENSELPTGYGGYFGC